MRDNEIVSLEKLGNICLQQNYDRSQVLQLRQRHQVNISFSGVLFYGD